MIKEPLSRARHYAVVTFGALALSVLTFGHAGAMSSDQCAVQSGSPAVLSVAVQQGSILVLWPDGNVFAANDTLQVYCRGANGANLGPVDNASVTINLAPQGGVQASAFTIQALGGVNTIGTNPAVIGPFTGPMSFRVTGASGILPAGATSAVVAMEITLVNQAFGAPLTDPGSGSALGIGTFGSVVARTPEIGSIVLFGAGAAGMAGYAMTRFRARRRD